MDAIFERQMPRTRLAVVWPKNRNDDRTVGAIAPAQVYGSNLGQAAVDISVLSI
jgi:hypothetical protein